MVSRCWDAELALASLLTVFVSCGAVNKTPNNDSSLDSAAPSSRSRVLSSLNGKIASITANAARGPSVGMWTDVVVAYNVSCGTSLESFSFTTDKVGIMTTIFASAVISQAKGSGAACLSIKRVEKIVTLPGLLTAKEVSLVNLTSPKVIDIPLGTIGYSADTKLEIVKTEPLCPKSGTCVLDGTAVTVRAHLGCTDQLGPVSYDFKESNDRKTGKLAISAINMVNKGSMTARCIVENVKDSTISLVNFFGTEKEIQLLIAK